MNQDAAIKLLRTQYEELSKERNRLQTVVNGIVQALSDIDAKIIAITHPEFNNGAQDE